ncbi:hypothetical protein EG329_003683 [Mollisiaceae sp. DMI_Dod_QoI]|nr:hypothetical protein EG329_003683 [Helotiales sp. DMI_Dod_QoI]
MGEGEDEDEDGDAGEEGRSNRKKGVLHQKVLWLPVSVRAGLRVAKPQGAPVGGGRRGRSRSRQASERASMHRPPPLTTAPLHHSPNRRHPQPHQRRPSQASDGCHSRTNASYFDDGRRLRWVGNLARQVATRESTEAVEGARQYTCAAARPYLLALRAHGHDDRRPSANQQVVHGCPPAVCPLPVSNPPSQRRKRTQRKGETRLDHKCAWLRQNDKHPSSNGFMILVALRPASDILETKTGGWTALDGPPDAFSLEANGRPHRCCKLSVARRGRRENRCSRCNHPAMHMLQSHESLHQ